MCMPDARKPAQSPAYDSVLRFHTNGPPANLPKSTPDPSGIQRASAWLVYAEEVLMLTSCGLPHSRRHSGPWATTLLMARRIPVVWLLLLPPLWGQDQAPEQLPASQDPPPIQRTRPPKDTGKPDGQKETSGTSKDRLFFTLPNFLTLENAGDVPPLTTAEKFKVTARGTFDPVEFLWYGAQAGIGQAEGHDPSYGQGAEGYAKRFANASATAPSRTFLHAPSSRPYCARTLVIFSWAKGDSGAASATP